MPRTSLLHPAGRQAALMRRGGLAWTASSSAAVAAAAAGQVAEVRAAEARPMVHPCPCPVPFCPGPVTTP